MHKVLHICIDLIFDFSKRLVVTPVAGIGTLVGNIASYHYFPLLIVASLSTFLVTLKYAILSCAKKYSMTSKKLSRLTKQFSVGVKSSDIQSHGLIKILTA